MASRRLRLRPRCFFIILFVVDFTDDFLDAIFEGGDPHRTAEFVHDDAHVRLARHEFAKKLLTDILSGTKYASRDMTSETTFSS